MFGSMLVRRSYFLELTTLGTPLDLNPTLHFEGVIERNDLEFWSTTYSNSYTMSHCRFKSYQYLYDRDAIVCSPRTRSHYA